MSRSDTVLILFCPGPEGSQGRRLLRKLLSALVLRLKAVPGTAEVILGLLNFLICC